VGALVVVLPSTEPEATVAERSSLKRRGVVRRQSRPACSRRTTIRAVQLREVLFTEDRKRNQMEMGMEHDEREMTGTARR
jgi:hypothetical protein